VVGQVKARGRVVVAFKASSTDGSKDAGGGCLSFGRGSSTFQKCVGFLVLCLISFDFFALFSAISDDTH